MTHESTTLEQRAAAVCNRLSVMSDVFSHKCADLIRDLLAALATAREDALPAQGHDARAVELVAQAMADAWDIGASRLESEQPKLVWINRAKPILDQLAAITPAPVTVHPADIDWKAAWYALDHDTRGYLRHPPAPIDTKEPK